MKTWLKKNWLKVVIGIVVVFLVAALVNGAVKRHNQVVTPVVTAENGKVFVPPPRVKTAAELEQENQILRQQIEMANSGRKTAEENQLPDGVKVTHMESRSLKAAPWKFMAWDPQGQYIFPLIANDQGKPTPIRSATPPPNGSLPQVPKGEWVLADWELKLPDGTQLALNGWAKRR